MVSFCVSNHVIVSGDDLMALSRLRLVVFALLLLALAACSSTSDFVLPTLRPTLEGGPAPAADEPAADPGDGGDADSADATGEDDAAGDPGATGDAGAADGPAEPAPASGAEFTTTEELADAYQGTLVVAYPSDWVSEWATTQMNLDWNEGQPDAMQAVVTPFPGLVAGTFKAGQSDDVAGFLTGFMNTTGVAGEVESITSGDVTFAQSVIVGESKTDFFLARQFGDDYVVLNVVWVGGDQTEHLPMLQEIIKRSTYVNDAM
jgi:hypothetical protein